jgi:hypothetical protein
MLAAYGLGTYGRPLDERGMGVGVPGHAPAGSEEASMIRGDPSGEDADAQAATDDALVARVPARESTEGRR